MLVAGLLEAASGLSDIVWRPSTAMLQEEGLLLPADGAETQAVAGRPPAAAAAPASHAASPSDAVAASGPTQVAPWHVLLHSWLANRLPTPPAFPTRASCPRRNG